MKKIAKKIMSLVLVSTMVLNPLSIFGEYENYEPDNYSLNTYDYETTDDLIQDFFDDTYISDIYSVEDAIVIKTAEDLQKINENLNASYVLANDIDLRGITWTPIGTEANPFKGSLDGKGYTISNLTADFKQRFVGIFAITSNAYIKNINLKNINITNTQDFTATLVGYASNNTKIENCSVVGGEVKNTGRYSTGGLIGDLDTSTIKNSYSSNKVIGVYAVGGLVGRLYTNTLVENSYSTSTVTGYEHVYGISSGSYADSSSITLNMKILFIHKAK